MDDVIEMVGLESVAHDRVRGFSLGMGQRLGIAAALLVDPDVLLLDEPVNGLDPEGIRWVRELLRDLAAGAGIALHELTVQRPSLEEAFMELTKDAVEYQTVGAAA